VLSAASEVLDYVYRDGRTVKEALGGAINRGTRLRIEAALRRIYEASLDRELKLGERAVFSEAISLLLQTFQGRSFREMVGIRYSRLSKRDNGQAGGAAFSQRANKLPDSSLEKPYSLFERDTLAKNVSYDAVVFDTYDYLDEVISFCLADTFIAAFRIYHSQAVDQRALKFVELLRFGTNDAMQILLIRYGFLPEDVDEILPHIRSISEQEITFRRTLSEASPRLREITEWYR
jgi:helicase